MAKKRKGNRYGSGRRALIYVRYLFPVAMLLLLLLLMQIPCLRYSTADNSTRCAAEIRNYTGNTYDLGNFQAVSDPASIKYTDGQVIYNGHFVANYTDSGSSYTADHHRTLRLVWEDGIWKVDAFSLLPDGAYSATTYAPLP